MAFAQLYSYLNLESTKTFSNHNLCRPLLYSYLNLESTKTFGGGCSISEGCTVT